MRFNTLIPSARLPVIACALAIAFYGCHKAGNDTSVTTTTTTGSVPADSAYINSIVISGCKYVGEYVTFSFSISGTGPVAVKDPVWDFGDGSQSSGATVQHIYTAQGTYQVTFTVNGKQLTGSVTINSYSVSSPHTALMAGKRHWVGHGSGTVNELYPLPSSGTVDTQLTLEVLNPGTVNLQLFYPNIVLHLTSDDPVKKVLVFTSCNVSTASVLYYYDADSIVYTNNWTATVGHGYEYFTIHTL